MKIRLAKPDPPNPAQSSRSPLPSVRRQLGVDGAVARPGAGDDSGERQYLELLRGIAKRRFLIFSSEALFDLGYIDSELPISPVPLPARIHMERRNT